MRQKFHVPVLRGRRVSNDPLLPGSTKYLMTLYNSAFDLHFGHPSRIIWLEGGLEYA